jgi:hypothetical protein
MVYYALVMRIAQLSRVRRLVTRAPQAPHADALKRHGKKGEMDAGIWRLRSESL